MKLWTMQTVSVLESLMQEGVLLADPALVFKDSLAEDLYRQAYDYMAQQMQERLPAASGSYPWWAWARPPTRRKDGGPDMRSYRNYAPVLMELEIDESRVLLSDHEGWHYVLNNWSLQTHELESIDTRESWSRIFDVTKDGLRTITSDPDWLSAQDLAIQACFWELRGSDVLSIKRYKEK